jgi:hypothetical protein
LFKPVVGVSCQNNGLGFYATVGCNDTGIGIVIAAVMDVYDR